MSAIDAFFKVGDDGGPTECVIEAYGDIDLVAAERMREILDAGLAESPDRLIIDLVGVTSIARPALSVLAAARQHGQSLGTDVILRSPSADTAHRIADADLSNILPIVYPHDDHRDRRRR